MTTGQIDTSNQTPDPRDPPAPPPFVPYGKTPRWSDAVATVLITEKIDGANVHVVVPQDPTEPLLVGSRTRWITPGKTTDCYNFAAWVAENEAAVRLLGRGRHDGEWWGHGIGRGYDCAPGERFWSLFDARRWVCNPHAAAVLHDVNAVSRGVIRAVPLLRHGEYDGQVIELVREGMRRTGSLARLGYMRPEGVVLDFHGKRYKDVWSKTGPSPTGDA